MGGEKRKGGGVNMWQPEIGWLLGSGPGTALTGSKLSQTSCLSGLAKKLVPYGTSPSRCVVRRITAGGSGARSAR